MTTTTNAAKAAEYSASPTTHPENMHDSSTHSGDARSSMRDSSPTLTQKLESLNPQTRRAAEQAAEGFNGFLRNTFINMLEQGQRLNELQGRMQNELGKKEGSIAFKIWLNSEEWDYTRTLAKNLMTVAKKYSTLPGKLKNQLRDKLNGWSLTAIKELLSAGKDIINKFKNRPTSAAAIQRAKKEETRKQQPVTNWTEVQKQYQNLTTQDLEAIKEIAELQAQKDNRPVQIQDVEKVADEYGFKKTKKQTKATTPSKPINKTKERIANYAIRQAQLEKAFKTAPENLKDDLALQIQSCKEAIAELSKGLEEGASLEDTSPTQTGKDPELLQRIADLELLVETLHQQNEELATENSYSEPAAPDSTIETLEQKLQEQEEAVATLKKQNEELKQKFNATPQAAPSETYNPVTTQPTSNNSSEIDDLKELNERLIEEIASLKNQAIEIQQPNEITDLQIVKGILQSTFKEDWSWEETEKQSQLPLKTVLKKASFTVDQLETACKEWNEKFQSTSEILATMEEKLLLLKSRQDRLLIKNNSPVEDTLKQLQNIPGLEKPKENDLVLVTDGPLKGRIGTLYGTTDDNTSLIETIVTKDRTYTRSTEYKYLIKLPANKAAK